MNNITENTATTPRSDLYPEGVEANSPIGMVWLALRLHGFENLEVFNKGVIAWWKTYQPSDRCIKMVGSFLLYDDYTLRPDKYRVYPMIRTLCDGKDVIPRSDPSAYDYGFSYKTMAEALEFIDKCVKYERSEGCIVL